MAKHKPRKPRKPKESGGRQAQSPPGAPPAPDWIGDQAKALWPAACHVLEQAGTLEQLAPETIAVYCQLTAQYVRVTDSIDRHGQVHEWRNDKGELKGQGPAPEVTIQMQLVAKLRQLWSDFGLLPNKQNAHRPAKPNQLAARLAGLGEIGRN